MINGIELIKRSRYEKYFMLLDVFTSDIKNMNGYIMTMSEIEKKRDKSKLQYLYNVVLSKDTEVDEETMYAKNVTLFFNKKIEPEIQPEIRYFVGKFINNSVWYCFDKTVFYNPVTSRDGGILISSDPHRNIEKAIRVSIPDDTIGYIKDNEYYVENVIITFRIRTSQLIDIEFYVSELVPTIPFTTTRDNYFGGIRLNHYKDKYLVKLDKYSIVYSKNGILYTDLVKPVIKLISGNEFNKLGIKIGLYGDPSYLEQLNYVIKLDKNGSYVGGFPYKSFTDGMHEVTVSPDADVYIKDDIYYVSRITKVIKHAQFIIIDDDPIEGLDDIVDPVDPVDTEDNPIEELDIVVIEDELIEGLNVQEIQKEKVDKIYLSNEEYKRLGEIYYYGTDNYNKLINKLNKNGLKSNDKDSIKDLEERYQRFLNYELREDDYIEEKQIEDKPIEEKPIEEIQIEDKSMVYVKEVQKENIIMPITYNGFYYCSGIQISKTNKQGYKPVYVPREGFMYESNGTWYVSMIHTEKQEEKQFVFPNEFKMKHRTLYFNGYKLYSDAEIIRWGCIQLSFKPRGKCSYEVTIPDDALVFKNNGKYYSNTIIIGDKVNLRRFYKDFYKMKRDIINQ